MRQTVGLEIKICWNEEVARILAPQIQGLSDQVSYAIGIIIVVYALIVVGVVIVNSVLNVLQEFIR